MNGTQIDGLVSGEDFQPMQSDTLNLAKPESVVAGDDWRSFFERARPGTIRMAGNYRE